MSQKTKPKQSQAKKEVELSDEKIKQICEESQMQAKMVISAYLKALNEVITKEFIKAKDSLNQKSDQLEA